MRIVLPGQHGQLLGQIMAEQVRAGDGGGIATGVGETAIGAGFGLTGRFPVPADAQLRVNK
ncbi:hypothetical protein D3C87_1823540 [compost metagenome]